MYVAKFQESSEKNVEGLEEFPLDDGVYDALGETHLCFAILALVTIFETDVIPKRYYLLQQPKHDLRYFGHSIRVLRGACSLIQL